jgi:putative DNA primase/helicase
MPQFTLIIVGNNKPALRTVDEAMRRRFNIIPFTHVPKTRDGRLKEKLQSEWPGILRWMINGALDWQQHGLVRPQVVIDATAEYFDDQNTMEQWIDQSCDVNKNDPYYYEQSSILFASWARYAKANGIEAGTSKTFKPALQKSGFLFKRDKSGRYFYGIRLKSTGQENDD